jgi:hypothetical protein
MICDLIWFFDYFLTGELTSRFVLKAGTVMAICGAIFVYYLGSLRWDRNTDVVNAKARSLKFGIGATAVVAATFCVGLGIAGTPSTQRQTEADLRRVQDLRTIANAIHSWRQSAQVEKSLPALPATLADLRQRGIDPARMADPETKTAYEYQRKSDNVYELCATFAAEEENSMGTTPFWHHGKGRTCFTLDASQPPVW